MSALLDAGRLRRAEFLGLGNAVYLNAASAGALPERARLAIDAFARRHAAVPELVAADFVEPLERCRRAAARLISAETEEIALGANTSFGINLAALGLPLAPGAVILASAGEFPANVYPWMAQQARGARLELVPTRADGNPDEARLLERLARGDVGILALSAVQFGSGYRADLERFGAACREHGAFFAVDAIQALGHLPLDVRSAGIDVLATGGHKWLLGPFGTGFAYVRRELLDVLQPRAIGWFSMTATQDFDHLTEYRWELLPDARRYEVATLPYQGLLGLAHSLELLMEIGVEAIERHVRALLDPLVDWLLERPRVELLSDPEPVRRSGILAFRPPAAKATYRALRQAGVHCAYREEAIRVSPHLYNTPAEIERVLQVLSRQEWS